MPSLYDLIMADEPGAQEQARAMAEALRGQKRLAQLGMLTGDKALSGFGQAAYGDVARQEAQLGEAAGTRLQQALRQKQLAQQGLAQQAEQGFRNRQLGLQSREVDLREKQLEQENWAAIADPVTGGIVAYNRKTGETRPLGPGGGRPGVSPTAQPGSVPGGVTPLPGISSKPTDAQKKAVLEKSQSIAGLDLAIDALEKAPGAYGGFGNFTAALTEQIGGTPAQSLMSRRYNPAELKAKNQISNVVSAIINQRAGANVTYREELRQKFLPQDTDSYKAALQKLKDLRDFETVGYEAQGAGLVPPVTRQEEGTVTRRRKWNPEKGALE